MDLTRLLGQMLKSTDVLALLEQADVDVIYDFDRNHEGTPDEYWANFHDYGFSLYFDEKQVLDAIFLYLVPDEDFEACGKESLEGIEIHQSCESARSFAQAKNLEFEEGSVENDDTLPDCQWIKIFSRDVSAHYEFGDSSLHRLTLARIKREETSAESY